MIDLYYWPTPNGWKVTIMLEECGLPYNIEPVNIGRGDQLSSTFQRDGVARSRSEGARMRYHRIGRHAAGFPAHETYDKGEET